MIKVIYVPAILKNCEARISSAELKKLPKKLSLLYSIQYLQLAKLVKAQLEKKGFIVEDFRQVLGCSKLDCRFPALLVSSGMFHAQNLFLQAPDVFVLEENKITKIPDKMIERLKAKREAAKIVFLKAETVGILASIKPGQENVKLALDLRKRIAAQGKRTFVFLADCVDVSQFENFDADCWVNTACQGLAYDSQKVIEAFEASKLLPRG